MEIYKHGVSAITLAGGTYSADERGIIDIPDHLQSGAFMQGFVSAKGRLKQLADQAEAVTGSTDKPAQPAVEMADEKPATPVPTKTAKPNNTSEKN